jgi:hypothetical protein
MAANITLPDSLVFGTKSGFPRIKTYSTPFSATNLTYNVSNQTVVRIGVPPIPEGYLETASSFLSFRASVATADLILDNSCYSFVNSLQLFSFNQSLLLENVTDHAATRSPATFDVEARQAGRAGAARGKCKQQAWCAVHGRRRRPHAPSSPPSPHHAPPPEGPKAGANARASKALMRHSRTKDTAA